MAVTAFWYVKSFLAAFGAEINFLSDAVNVGLTSSLYTPNQDTHAHYSDITNELSTADGYTAGGQALASKTLASSTNVATFDAADPVWTTGAGETLTAHRAFYYDSTPGTAATDPLISWIDFGGDESASNGGTFTIQIDAAGIATITPTNATGFP